MSNVVDLGDGFAFESKKNGRQEFRDEQVINLVLSYKPEHLQGRQTGRVRNFFVWIKGEPKLFLNQRSRRTAPVFCFWMKTEQKAAKNAKTQLNTL